MSRIRLRLTIKRHELPSVSILHTIPTNPSPTISELVSQVDQIVPLESGSWGKEDYVVSVGRFECLHFANAAEILQDNDEVTIRAVKTGDVHARRLTGRSQISHSGARLLDGVPFGRKFFAKTQRPPVDIPPMNKRRLMSPNRVEQDSDSGEDSDDADYEEEEEEEEAASSGNESDYESVAEHNDDDGNAPVDSGQKETEEEVAIQSARGKKRKRARVVEPRYRGTKRNIRHHSTDTTGSPESSTSSDDGSVASDASLASSSEESVSDEGETRPRRQLPKRKHITTWEARRMRDADDTSASSSETSSDDSISSTDSSKDSAASTELTSPPERIGSSTQLALKKAAPKSKSDPMIEQSDQVKPLQTPPGQGSRRTRARNQRRKLRLRQWHEAQLNENMNTSEQLVLDEEKQQDVVNTQKALDAAPGPSLAAQNHVDVNTTSGEFMHENRQQKLDERRELESRKAQMLAYMESLPRVKNLSGEAAVNGQEAEPEIASGTAADLAQPVPVDDPSPPPTIDPSTKPKPRPQISDAAKRMIAHGLPAAFRKPKTQPATPPPDTTATHTTNVDDANDGPTMDNYSHKLTISVQECVAPVFDLGTPPFPFVQRWHGKRKWEFEERMPNAKKRKKRARNATTAAGTPGGGLDYGDPDYGRDASVTKKVKEETATPVRVPAKARRNSSSEEEGSGSG